MDIQSILQQTLLFSSLEPNALHELSENLRFVNLPEGQILMRENDIGDCFYMIVEGRLKIIKAMGTAEERLLQEFGPGEFLGEMSMFDPKSRRTATVVTGTRAILIEMSHHTFRTWCHRQPDLAFEVAKELSMRLRNSDNATINELQEKNRQLAHACVELQKAHLQVVEKEKLERELQVAREIQESILPHKLPVFPGVDMAALMRPARTVGGDLYDLIALDRSCLGVVIGDVSDKGVPAAIFMALVRSLLRAEASRMAPPSVVLREVNRHLLDMNSAGLFVTVIYGLLDCNCRIFTFARAGHEHPFFFRKDGTEIDTVNSCGQPLGLFDDVLLEESTVYMPSETRLVLYTDGATDAVDPQGERFTRDRLREAARSHMNLSAHQCCQMLLETIVQFQAGTPQTDDVALVVIDFQ